MGLKAMASTWKMFPNERLGWLVYETQHLSIYIHLQAMACKRGWLEYENGLSNDFSFPNKNKLAQPKAAPLLIGTPKGHPIQRSTTAKLK